MLRAKAMNLNAKFASVFRAKFHIPITSSKFLFRFSGNRAKHCISRFVQRGVRVVTNVEAGCDGHGWLRATSAIGVDGEVVWSWHPGADAKFAAL
jgi:hypothetical protein